ncbi:MAG: MerC domain-containing protein [Bacteroidota bacterium]
MANNKYHTGADKLGIASAVICTVHCLVVPALFLLKFSSMGGSLPGWWDKLDFVFLIVSFGAVFHASSHSAGKAIKYLLWIFWSFLAIAIFFEHTLHWMAYIASTGLIATHISNIRKHHLQVVARRAAANEPAVTEA